MHIDFLEARSVLLVCLYNNRITQIKSPGSFVYWQEVSDWLHSAVPAETLTLSSASATKIGSIPWHSSEFQPLTQDRFT